MKRSAIYMMTAVTLIAGLLMISAEAKAADWRLIRQSSYGDATYYDAASVKRLDGQVVSLMAKIGGRDYRYEMRCGKKEARLLGEGDDNRWFPVAGDEELIYQAVCAE
ncbi:MAG: hypothetical protein HZA15_02160 [Nitrospirae bacterium]|nr:hypothetical protein [Nitrospirota bacterium]